MWKMESRCKLRLITKKGLASSFAAFAGFKNGNNPKACILNRWTKEDLSKPDLEMLADD